MKNKFRTYARSGRTEINASLFGSFGLLVVGLILAILVTKTVPKVPAGGWAQKIIYIHVPFAIGSFIAFFFGFVAATVYLINRDRDSSLFSIPTVSFVDMMKAFVEVGFLYSCAVLLTGPLWAKPVWGAFWSFEPRLNTFAIMWSIYAVYFVVTPFIQENTVRRTFQAVWVILGFLTVPMVYLSVKMIPDRQQLHPASDDRNLQSIESMTVLLILAGFFLLFVALSWLRFRMLSMDRYLKWAEREKRVAGSE